MRQKLIYDDKLLELYQEGKTQSEIAEHFGVSQVAISKRLKRLLPPPDLTKFNLTKKEKQFAIEKAKGKTNTQAAMASYDVSSLESAKSIGTQLMSKSEIRDAIEGLMDFHGLTRSYRIGRLKTHCDARDPNVSLKAIDLANKMDNTYPAARDIDIGHTVVHIHIERPERLEMDVTPKQE